MPATSARRDQRAIQLAEVAKRGVEHRLMAVGVGSVHDKNLHLHAVRLPAHPQVIGDHRAGITNGYVARVSAAARPERSAPIAPPLRMAAISAGEASISPRVFWEKRP
ncbi:MAG: hypothetical protein NT042_10275 [Sulfuritalea sp.]|nr:hypothetical protein [Sulfuritalea sp.]